MDSAAASDCDVVVDPEVFIGFESGAIGMFKILIDEKAGEYGLQIVKLFTGQKVI